jgi:hypothetical protein
MNTTAEFTSTCTPISNSLNYTTLLLEAQIANYKVPRYKKVIKSKKKEVGNSGHYMRKNSRLKPVTYSCFVSEI